MQAPKVKVAVIIGAEMIRLRSNRTLQLGSSTASRMENVQGEMRFSPSKAVPGLQESWLWCGVFDAMSGAETARKILENHDLEVRILPVGLTPVDGDWSPRQFRLLVRSEEDLNSSRHILEAIQTSLPVIKPVRITLPEVLSSGAINIENPGGLSRSYQSPVQLTGTAEVELIEAPVGEGFHWEHSETLEFPTPFWIELDSDGKLCAGTEIGLEEYLTSVNSSEMPSESPPEFLKAQVVAARSWILATWGSHHPGESYTVCAGDHCQCYYGSSRVREASRTAAASTSGEVLIHNQRVCDARYAKSCGGVTEPAANVWPFIREEYMGHLRDLPDTDPISLTEEEAFQAFQQRRNEGDACCAPGYADFDEQLAELSNLYRWEENVGADELREIIRRKLGTDPGEISEITPLRRGPSGRLMEVGIRGNEMSMTIGPELEIRRILSRSHLPSSAFWIERTARDCFIFHGMGWGHGAGLCQIGAAALAQNGSDHTHILAHYYPSTSIAKIY